MLMNILSALHATDAEPVVVKAQMITKSTNNHLSHLTSCTRLNVSLQIKWAISKVKRSYFVQLNSKLNSHVANFFFSQINKQSD